jgi:hypothetical protein
MSCTLFWQIVFVADGTLRSCQHDDPQSHTSDVNLMSAPLTVPICPVPRVSPGQKKGSPLVPLCSNEDSLEGR